MPAGDSARQFKTCMASNGSYRGEVWCLRAKLDIQPAPAYVLPLGDSFTVLPRRGMQQREC